MMQKKHLTVGSWRHLRLLAPVLAVAFALIIALPAFAWAAATSSGVTAPAAPPASSSQPTFGPNVYIFNPSMPLSQTQSTVNSIANHQVPNHFGTHRPALLFKPRPYPP